MSTTKQISIFIAEDHLTARLGLRMLLEQTDHFNVVGEAEDGEAAVEQILQLKPEVVIMDLGMPKIDGVKATAMLKKDLPSTKVLIFTTAEDDESIFSSLKAGADGYCLKTISGELLANAIESVLKGAAWLDPGIANRVLRAQANSKPEHQDILTDSKIKLLSLVEQGKSVDEIASELKVNDILVKGLMKELMTQLQARATADDEKPADSTVKTKFGEVSIKVGETVGDHYHVEEMIGYGGMGCVYQARHQHIGRKVAVKTMHDHLVADGGTLERFKAEAAASASATHPNLVTIYDFGLLQGRLPYIIMEYLDGVSLSDILKEHGSIDEEIGKHIFSQVAAALNAVHKKGIVHRDLKPSNIMIIKTDDDPHFVKLVDFGIAKVLHEGAKNLTATGEAIGSPPYMSPEQCYGTKLDHRSDLYSLGCTMFEAFSGDTVFPSVMPIEVLMKHVNQDPDREPLERAELSPELVDLIMSLLEKKPDNRPATAQAVAEKLR